MFWTLIAVLAVVFIGIPLVAYLGLFGTIIVKAARGTLR